MALSKILVKCVKQTSVEPMVLAYFTGFAMFTTTAFSTLFFKICEQNYQDGTIDCGDLDANGTIQDKVEDEAGSYSQYSAVALTIPAILTNMLMGAWGDLHGRKINFIMSIAGSIFVAVGYILNSIYIEWPLYTIPLISAVGGFSGFNMLFGGSAYNYIADTVTDEEWITLRLTITTACWSGGFAIGGLIAAALLQSGISFAIVIVIGIGFMIVALVYCLIFIKHCPPIHEDIIDPPDEGKHSLVLSGFYLLKEVWVTFTKPRRGHFRAYLLLLIFAYAPYITVDQGLDAVIGLFVYHRPLKFTPALYSIYWSSMAALLIFGTLAFSFLFKRLFKFHELTIVLVSIASALLKLIALGISTSNWMVFFSSGVGFLYALGYPVINSFLTQIVPPNELGKVLGGLGLAANSAPLIANVVYVEFYKLTLHIYAGLAFFLVAALVLISFIIIFFIRIDYLHFMKNDSLSVENF